MHTHTLFKVALHVIASIVCVSSLLMFPLDAQTEAQAAPQNRTLLSLSRPHAGSPVRLRIPRIKVDAAIESVGLTAKGAMDLPSAPNDVGWYNLGPRPGEQGNAVLAGHLDWYNGQTAVFQHLDRVQKGDVLSVETDAGRSLLFVVREIRTYQSDAYAPDVFQNGSGSHLNLVTCDGAWDAVRKIYTKRLVLFADAVGEM